MEKTDIVILENNQSIVDRVTNRIVDILDSRRILSVDAHSALDSFDINDTLFISTDKEWLLSQLNNFCEREELAVFEKRTQCCENCSCIYCVGKAKTMYGCFQNNTTKSEEKDYKTDCIIDKIFSILGIRRHLLGAIYLNYAIKLAVENPYIVVHGITTRLYPSIAKIYHTTPSKVERSIRHTLENCYNFGKFIFLNELFKTPLYTPLDKPSNGEFISLMADKISLRLQDTKYLDI